MTDPSREQLLRLLIAGSAPSRDVARRLAAFGWDSDRELVVLTRDDAVSLLERYLRGELDAASVEEWAEVIEGRDDVGYQAGSEDLLATLVFELANPDISGPLTPGVATDLAERLRAG